MVPLTREVEQALLLMEETNYFPIVVALALVIDRDSVIKPHR